MRDAMHHGDATHDQRNTDEQDVDPDVSEESEPKEAQQANSDARK